jgi:hypothetical protein
MHPNVPYFIILLCLMPDNFTLQGKSVHSMGQILNSIYLAANNKTTPYDEIMKRMNIIFSLW